MREERQLVKQLPYMYEKFFFSLVLLLCFGREIFLLCFLFAAFSFVCLFESIRAFSESKKNNMKIFRY